MPPHDIESRDQVRLTHMLWAAREALDYARGRARESLESDSMFRRAVVSCLQEIGEAASRTSPETRALTTGLPWGQIVGMRHRLVHDYFNIDLDLVWQVLERHLRPLVSELERLLPEGT